MKTLLSRKFLNYLSVYLLIAISGIPFYFQEKLWTIIIFLFSLLFFIIKKQKTDKFFIIVILILSIVELAYIFKWNDFEVNQIFSIFMRFFIAYAILKIVGKEFFNIFIKIIYFHAIVSLCIFLPSFFIPSVQTFFESFISNLAIENLYSWRSSMILYTIEYGILRNAGPFWEAGAFATYLLIALTISLFLTKKIKTPTNIILLITIFTTFSTAGFLTLFVILLFFNLLSPKKSLKMLYLFGVLIAFIIIYQNTDFMRKKIELQLEYAFDKESNYMYVGRFSSALNDLKDISENPLIGRGRGAFRYKNFSNIGNNEERFLEEKRTNGITDFIVKMGIPFALFYFTTLFISLKAYFKYNDQLSKYHLVLFLAILLMGFSQLIFLHPFFISLLFLQVIYPKFYANSFFKTNVSVLNNRLHYE